MEGQVFPGQPTQPRAISHLGLSEVVRQVAGGAGERLLHDVKTDPPGSTGSVQADHHHPQQPIAVSYREPIAGARMTPTRTVEKGLVFRAGWQRRR